MQGAVLFGPRDVRFEDREARQSFNPRMPPSGWWLPACVGPTCGMGGRAKIDPVRDSSFLTAPTNLGRCDHLARFL
jgi:hypothetical protein